MTPMTTQLMTAVPRDRAGIGSAMNDTTRELGGALRCRRARLARHQPVHVRRVGAAALLPAEAREVAEASIGGVHGLIDQGRPGEVANSLLDTAKDAFVDGLGIAAATAAVIVAVVAIAVRRLLPSDRHNEAITGAAEPVAAARPSEVRIA